MRSCDEMSFFYLLLLFTSSYMSSYNKNKVDKKSQNK